jgi:hypothetical protein
VAETFVILKQITWSSQTCLLIFQHIKPLARSRFLQSSACQVACFEILHSIAQYLTRTRCRGPWRQRIARSQTRP